MRRTAIIAVLLLAGAMTAGAQKNAVSTDAALWAYMLTPNLEYQRAVGRHWTVDAGARINAWSWNTRCVYEQRRTSEVKARQQTYWAGMRWWPWNACSGWWAGLKAQYSEYDNGGVGFVPWIPDNESGNAVGAGIWGGYAYQLSQHWNLDLGIGLWGGWKRYTTYECPWCGLTTGSGEKAFVLPNDAMISVQYVF